MFAFLKRLLGFHWFLTLILMGAFALIFGLVSLNIFMVLRANLGLIAEHGAMALFDGALHQLLQLLIYGYLAVIFYVLFKACEQVLVAKILR
jgi:hypothetical protein